MDRRACVAWAAALACSVCALSRAQACVADVFTLDRLSTDADFVVEATVGDIHSAWNADHTSIESTITLTSVRRITRAGSDDAPDVTFTTLGGTVDDFTLRISCVPQLNTGDRWVLFLQQTFHQSPVLGMERGMFQIETVDGVERLTGVEGAPVVGVDADGAVILSPKDEAEGQPVPTRMRSTSGSIRAVRVVSHAEPAQAEPHRTAPAPMTVDAFLDAVRARMPADRADAGPIDIQWVKPRYRAARFKSAEEVRGEVAPGVGGAQ